MIEREISPKKVDIERPRPITKLADAPGRGLEAVSERKDLERLFVGAHEKRGVQKIGLRRTDRSRPK